MASNPDHPLLFLYNSFLAPHQHDHLHSNLLLNKPASPFPTPRFQRHRSISTTNVIHHIIILPHCSSGYFPFGKFNWTKLVPNQIPSDRFLHRSVNTEPIYVTRKITNAENRNGLQYANSSQEDRFVRLRHVGSLQEVILDTKYARVISWTEKGRQLLHRCNYTLFGGIRLEIFRDGDYECLSDPYTHAQHSHLIWKLESCKTLHDGGSQVILCLDRFQANESLESLVSPLPSPSKTESYSQLDAFRIQYQVTLSFDGLESLVRITPKTKQHNCKQQRLEMSPDMLGPSLQEQLQPEDDLDIQELPEQQDVVLFPYHVAFTNVLSMKLASRVILHGIEDLHAVNTKHAIDRYNEHRSEEYIYPVARPRTRSSEPKPQLNSSMQLPLVRPWFTQNNFNNAGIQLHEPTNHLYRGLVLGQDYQWSAERDLALFDMYQIYFIKIRKSESLRDWHVWNPLDGEPEKIPDGEKLILVSSMTRNKLTARPEDVKDCLNQCAGVKMNKGEAWTGWQLLLYD